jgi:pyruvate dehydrogenase E1 component alpha subunit
MKSYGYWDEQWIEEMKEKTMNEVEAAVEEMENYPPPKVEDVFDHVYAVMPKQLAEQKESYLAHLGRR